MLCNKETWWILTLNLNLKRQKHCVRYCVVVATKAKTKQLHTLVVWHLCVFDIFHAPSVFLVKTVSWSERGSWKTKQFLIGWRKQPLFTKKGNSCDWCWRFLCDFCFYKDKLLFFNGEPSLWNDSRSAVSWAPLESLCLKNMCELLAFVGSCVI